MTIQQQNAYIAGYRHGWYAPTHSSMPAEYWKDLEFKQYYDRGFEVGSRRQPPEIEVVL